MSTDDANVKTGITTYQGWVLAVAGSYGVGVHPHLVQWHYSIAPVGVALYLVVATLVVPETECTSTMNRVCTDEDDQRAISMDPRPVYPPSSTSPDESSPAGHSYEILVYCCNASQDKNIEIVQKEHIFHQRQENGSRG